ncbi:hypothetical protein [Streptomyces sp. ME19-01-6]|uniref:hypothetical protein n=1 Tax=Streptomyces sp. ME19-01-6 TaxID=3028686 RepID=UPI00299FDA4A|nr:hypothetical protein [Streptomyces sp. ME19-01-6]MDX3226517.1 hypothetical protein [Streptomyces sp. ME19-01-6]
MSVPDSAPPAAPDDAERPGEMGRPPQAEDSGPEEQPQKAREARRELYGHAPEFMFEASAAFGGSLIGGSQHGVSGGQVHGDVVMGGKIEHHHHGAAGPAHASGEIPTAEIEALDEVFRESGAFTTALDRMRTDRYVVLAGAHSTGRHAAALMLLRRLGITTVRALDPEVSPAALRDQLGDAPGHVLCDLVIRRGKPLRGTHLLAVRERLEKTGGHLVITVERDAPLIGVTPVPWKPPPAKDVLRAHLVKLVDAPAIDRLMTLEPVRGFLAQDHRVADVVSFARELASYDRGLEATGLEELATFSRRTVEKRVRQWFADPGLPLREKAFLISLAAFDQAPYPLAAALADQLYALLQEVQNPTVTPEVPVFGPAADDRLQHAHARGREEHENTEWGPVPQFVTGFQDSHTARFLLAETWTAHPSARPALVRWVQELARDRHPVVRTRAAATAALLAAADLPSAMALLIDGWATARAFAPRLVAANALTLAHLSGAPAVPRILSQWCSDPHPARRWTAIRAYALLAPLRPDQAGQALEALAARAREDASNEAEWHHLTQSAALLLTAGSREAMLAELVRFFRQETSAVRALVLSAFLTACEPDEDGLLAWFTEDGGRAEAALRDLATLWRAALDDRVHTKDALGRLRTWVYEADRHPSTEEAVAALLPELAVTTDELARLGHLLRTMPGEHGGPPPGAAARLLSALTSR